MAGYKIKELFVLDKKPRKGLIPMEWAILAYLIFTSLLMVIMQTSLHNPGQMITFRLRILILMFAMWAIYRIAPCPLTMFIRVAAQISMLADWYPDVYEFNRQFVNLDYLFCGWEQTIFGCQPSIEFSRLLPWGIVSEPFCMGYVAYYPIITFTALFYFIYRKNDFNKAVYMIMASFFIYYVIFIFLPVAGPTFYYKAVGMDKIQQGVFPALGHYFETRSSLTDYCLPTPGWKDGLFWYFVEVARFVGERPSAAFPSSHVGVTTVCMWLLWFTNNRKIFYRTLPFAVLLFFATFYIQAHYCIDAIAGLISGTIIYFALNYLYKR